MACFEAIIFKYKIHPSNVVITSLEAIFEFYTLEHVQDNIFMVFLAPKLTISQLMTMTPLDGSVFQDHDQVDKNSPLLANPPSPSRLY